MKLRCKREKQTRNCAGSVKPREASANDENDSEGLHAWSVNKEFPAQNKASNRKCNHAGSVMMMIASAKHKTKQRAN